MPGIQPPGPGSEGQGQARNRAPWGGVDLVGGIGLSLAAVMVVLFAGGLADAILDEERPEAIAALLAAIAAMVATLVMARFTGLATTPTLNGVALLTAANVAVHIVSGADDRELMGLPPSIIESAIVSGVPFLVAWLYVSRKHHLSLGSLGFRRPQSPAAYLYAIGAWFLASIGVGLWSILVSDISTISPPDNATPVLEVAGGSLFTAWLLVGLWGPVVEEIFFRGFLIGGLRWRFGGMAAVLVSSAIFALFHILPGLYVPTFLLGVAFGWVYLKTGSIWPPVLAHMLHNTLVLVTLWQDSA